MNYDNPEEDMDFSWAFDADVLSGIFYADVENANIQEEFGTFLETNGISEFPQMIFQLANCSEETCNGQQGDIRFECLGKEMLLQEAMDYEARSFASNWRLNPLNADKFIVPSKEDFEWRSSPLSPDQFIQPSKEAVEDDKDRRKALAPPKWWSKSPRSPTFEKTNLKGLPTHQTQPLEGWLKDNMVDPYPSKEIKLRLAAESGLKLQQVSQWLTRARKRAHKKVEAFRARLLQESPPLNYSLAGSSLEVNAASGKGYAPAEPAENDHKLEERTHPDAGLGFVEAIQCLTKVEQWLENLPDDGFSTTFAPSLIHSNNLSFERLGNCSNNMDDTDFESWGQQLTELISKIAASESIDLEARNPKASSKNYSRAGSTHGSVRSACSYTTLGSRRGRRLPFPGRGHTSSMTRGETYRCTFCDAPFNLRYQWARHEESTHLCFNVWQCGPKKSINNATHLPLCDYHSPESPRIVGKCCHETFKCWTKGKYERRFYRKDAFLQHLRGVHHLEDADASVAARCHTRKQVKQEYLKCPFCARQFDDWDSRRDHVAKHFETEQTPKIVCPLPMANLYVESSGSETSDRDFNVE